MAGYNELKGLRVKYLSADPANPEDGQVWYNSTTGNLRVQGIGVGAWSSSSPTSSQHGDGSGCGEQTATVIWGGYSPDNPQITNSTEEYNGSGWTTGGNYPTTTIGSGSAGVLTAALGISGRTGPGGNTNVVNNYDGSSWTATTNYPASNYGTIGFGSQTAAVGLGGNPRADAAPSGVVNSTFDWNGSAWTASGNYPSTISNAGGTGSETAGITAGGYNNSGTSQTFSATYNGSTWTAGPNINRPADNNMAQAGNQTSSLIYGGSVNAVKTESWDGTAWSNQPDLAGVGGYGGQMGATNNSSGSSKGLLAATREGSNYPVATEEYNFSSTTVTPAAWSSGGAFPTASSQVAGAGPRDAALGIGGYPEGSIPTGKSYEYNGVAWSTEATLNPSTGTAGVNAAAGTQTACINTQNTGGGAPYSYTAAGEYDGTSWTNANTRPADNYSNAGAGTLTAGLFFGGTSSPTGTTNATVSYDGTNWTVESPLNTGRSELAGSGVQTAALGSGGYSNPPPTFYASTEEYNGTSWTTVNSLNTETRNGKSSGFQTDAIIMGGRNPGPVNTTNSFRYDGTVWSTAPSLATARNNFGNGATSPVGAAWGSAGYYPGSSPNRTNTTEHFNVETVAVNPASNLSVS